MVSAQTPVTEASILIVDDEDSNVRLLERMLGGVGYSNLASTTDPRRVMALFAEREPDLIVLDLHMPHLDGFEVMRRLKPLIPEGAYLPILILTADAAPDALARGLTEGAQDFLTKPFNVPEALLRVGNLLQTRFLHRELEQQNQRLEEKVRERTDRLHRALGVEREATQKLRALDDLKDAFLTSVSHELRTPLTAVLGNVLTLEAQASRLSVEERDALIHGAVTQARTLANLISDLLEVRLLTGSKAEPIRTPIDISALIERVLEDLTLPADHPLEVQVDQMMVDVDPTKVGGIVKNLLLNAVRHTPPGTDVYVKARLDDGGLLIVVEDSGPGVPEDLRATIFEPLEHGEHLVEHAPGIGIGLTLVGSYAEMHGGRAWVEARHGGGASFRVLLPVAPDEAVFPGAARE